MLTDDFKLLMKKQPICNIFYHRMNTILDMYWNIVPLDIDDYWIKLNKQDLINKSFFRDQCALEVFNALNKKNINFVALKGFYLAYRYYTKPYERLFSDIDILIDKSDANKVAELLYDLGYQNINSKDNNTVLSRKEIIRECLLTHQLPDFVKELSPDLFSKIDINYQFSWVGANNKNTNFSIIEDIDFTETIVVNGVVIRGFKPEYLLLHLCSHFFDEAMNFMFSNYIPGTQSYEIRLFRLYDVCKLLDTINFDVFRIKDLAEKVGVLERVSFVISLIKFLFPNSLENKWEFAVRDIEEFNWFYNINNQKQIWGINMNDRLFNLKKKEEYLKSLLN